MSHPNEKRFEDFFANDTYVVLKNHVYSYIVRKWAVETGLVAEGPRLVLEVGSGLSPMITSFDRVVYSDLSFEGLKTLRKHHPSAWHVVADCSRLPFKSDTFSHTVSSEVLEHVERDQDAICELSRVLAKNGRLYVTFPHRKFYYWNDDHFVKHFRRYELDEMIGKLNVAGLKAKDVQKVLGPLDKLSISFAIFILPYLEPFRWGASGPRRTFQFLNRIYAYLNWLDAKIMPRALSAVLLVKADKS
ncbi:MAG: class I SAM-dependent methyltransferase [Candidatus Hydrogenedentes bacterium]|nr:class I SAM-dependent methyltransferase [Candidatus Hydrogenedentota bacterium]